MSSYPFHVDDADTFIFITSITQLQVLGRICVFVLFSGNKKAKRQKGNSVYGRSETHHREVFEREDIDWMDAVDIKPGARLEPCPLR